MPVESKRHHYLPLCYLERAIWLPPGSETPAHHGVLLSVQSLRRRPSKLRVAGSIPAGPTIFQAVSRSRATTVLPHWGAVRCPARSNFGGL